MNNHTCPTCGQRMLLRCGVRLPPRLADLFDAIQNATSRGGITIETLSWMFYPDVSKRDAANSVKQNVHRINEMLVQTDYRVVMPAREGGYQVVLHST